MTALDTGTLAATSVWDHLDLVAAPVKDALQTFKNEHPDLATDILVAEIDPDLADTDVLTEECGLDPALSVNCILVSGKRDGEIRTAACAVRATTRADVNHTIKRLLDVRKASFMSQDDAVESSGMEYGGITPIGRPEEWRLLVDSRAAEGWACIGSGLRKSKLFVSGEVLAALPGVEVVEGLAVSVA